MSSASSSFASPARARYSRASGCSPRAKRAAYSSKSCMTSLATGKGGAELLAPVVEGLVDGVPFHPELSCDLVDLLSVDQSTRAYLALPVGEIREQLLEPELCREVV